MDKTKPVKISKKKIHKTVIIIICNIIKHGSVKL